MKRTIKNLTPTVRSNPQGNPAPGSSSISHRRGSILGGSMLITRNYEEPMGKYKMRLIREVELGSMSAEEAFDCYEEAVMKERV